MRVETWDGVMQSGGGNMGCDGPAIVGGAGWATWAPGNGP
jgi:hypothetical protein